MKTSLEFLNWHSLYIIVIVREKNYFKSIAIILKDIFILNTCSLYCPIQQKTNLSAEESANPAAYIKGSRNVAVVRGLTYHQCGLGSIPAWCHIWVVFVVGSQFRLAPRVFPWVLQYSFLQ